MRGTNNLVLTEARTAGKSRWIDGVRLSVEDVAACVKHAPTLAFDLHHFGCVALSHAKLMKQY